MSKLDELVARIEGLTAASNALDVLVEELRDTVASLRATIEQFVVNGGISDEAANAVNARLDVLAAALGAASEDDPEPAPEPEPSPSPEPTPEG